jgi:hypothetical protein
MRPTAAIKDILRGHPKQHHNRLPHMWHIRQCDHRRQFNRASGSDQ